MEPFEKTWKTEAESLRVDPSEKLWSRIELQLDNTRLRRSVAKKRIAVYGLVASLFLFISSTIFFDHYNRDSRSDLVVEEFDWQHPAYEQEFAEFYLLQRYYLDQTDHATLPRD